MTSPSRIRSRSCDDVFYVAIFSSVGIGIWSGLDPLGIGTEHLGTAFLLRQFALSLTLMTPGILLGALFTSRWGRIGAIATICIATLWMLVDAWSVKILGEPATPSLALNALQSMPAWSDDLSFHSIFFAGLHFVGAIGLVLFFDQAIVRLGHRLPFRMNRKATTVSASIVGMLLVLSLFKLTPAVSESTPLGNDQGEITIATDRVPIEKDRLRWLTAAPLSTDAGGTLVHPSHPDIVIVIIESFRHELVTSETMPTLFEAASNGWWFQNHFSSGNATSHGFFTLFNGVNATKFGDRSRRYDPLLPRLFSQTGYEVGFFAGDHDWERFQMDGFISAQHFDPYSISRSGSVSATGSSLASTHARAKTLESDRQSVERLIRYLDRPMNDQDRPRLAILYLYATHAPYRSYADDRVFHPAMSDYYRIPYAKSDASKVWNRYRNSARTVDRWIKAIMPNQLSANSKNQTRNRILVVTGDHGESFTEDGSMLHGTGISLAQNSTPLIIYDADLSKPKEGKSITRPTSHADILPTLIGLAGIRLSLGDAVDSSELFDGVDLIQDAASLHPRTIVTRDYLTDEIWKIDSDFER